MRFCIVSVLVLFAGCSKVPNGNPSAASKTQPALQVVEVTDADLPASVAIEESSTIPSGPKVQTLDYTLGAGYRYRNLTIFPLVSTAISSDAEIGVITLDEGLRSGTVTAHEIGKGDNAEVNQILVENKSGKALYLMPGETLIGGKQDRTIAEETVIPPNLGPTRVAVYCVEHGRWNSRRSADQASLLEALSEWTEGMAAEDLQQLVRAAENGRFVATTGILNRSIRRAVQFQKGQQRVWEEVSRVNVANDTQTATSTFTANYTDPETAKLLKAYQAAFADRIAEESNVIGVVVAVNGVPVASDAFGDSRLFQKLWPKLLKGFALDAIVCNDSALSNPACTKEVIDRFLEKMRVSNNTGTSATKGELSVTTHESIGSFESQSADYQGRSLHKVKFE